MPWDYLKVNSIFQVIQNAGMRTAWSDKHAIYTSFNGPGSGGNEHRRLLRPGDRLAGGRAERRAVPDRHGLGARRRRHQAVRRLQGAGGRQRDQWLRPQRQEPGRHAGDLRDELPDRVGRREGRLAEHPHARTRTAPTRRARSSSPATTRARRRRARCWPARWTTSTLSCSGWSTAIQANPDTRELDGDHRHGQARSVAAGSAAAEADQGRPDHRRDQRGLDRARPAIRTT